MRIGCSSECCEHGPCGLVGFPATTSTLRFPARPGGSTFRVVPRFLAKAGSSSRELCLLFRVRTASNLPPARMRGAPSLGSRSQSRYEPRRSTYRAKIPTPPYVPPSAFRTPSTVCSLLDLVGLFHPTTTSGIRLSGVCSRHPAGATRRRSVPSCRWPPAPTVELPRRLQHR
jgi:hypothetical protein